MNRNIHNSLVAKPAARSGFSLVEMLVILAIVAVLAAILFPVLTSGRPSAKHGNDLEKTARLAQASVLYAEDFNGTFVSIGAPAQNFAWSPAVNPKVDAAGNPWMSWGLRIAPYESDYQHFLMDADPTAVTFSGACSASGQMTLTNDFAANWMLGSDGTYGDLSDLNDPYAWSPDGTRLFDQPESLSQIADQTGTVAFLPSNASSTVAASTGCLASTLQASDFANNVQPGTYQAEGQDIAFADGHATYVDDVRMTARYQGESGPWVVYHLRSKHVWMEPTMPFTSLGYTNTDVNGNFLGDL